MKLHNSLHLLKVCLNNANRPKLIIIIIIIIIIMMMIIIITKPKGIRIFTKMFEQNRRKKLYVTTSYYDW